MGRARGRVQCAEPGDGHHVGGEPQAEALRNLAEATALYLEEFPLPLGERLVITTFHIADVA